MGLFECVDFLVAGVFGELGGGLLLDQHAQLIGVADQPQAGLDHLDAALRHDLHQALDLEALEGFAYRSKGNAGHLHEFALRDELSRPDVT